MSGGGSGAVSPEGGCAEWRRTYDRLEALLPRVEELAANRARLQHELLEARENSLHARLLQAEASRRRWKEAYTDLPPGANPKLAELQESDFADSKACEALLDVDSSPLMIQPNEAGDSAKISEDNIDHADIVRDLRAGLRKLKQDYETLSSNKDKEVAAKDFVWKQFRSMDRDNAAILKIKQVEVAQANEAAQKLRHNVEELQVAVRDKDDEIVTLRAEAGLLKIKEAEATRKFRQNVEELQVALRNKHDEYVRLRAEAVNARKRVLILKGKLLEMHSLVKEKNDEILKLRNGQPESLKCKCGSSVSNETGEDIGLLSKKEDQAHPSEDTSEMHLEQCMETSKDVGLFPEKEDNPRPCEDTNEMHLEQCTETSEDNTDEMDLEQCSEASEDSDEMHLEQGTMQIFVQILNGKTFSLEVNKSDTISDVKAKIQDKEGIPAEQQILKFNNRSLGNYISLSLRGFDIQEGTTLHLALWLHIFVKTWFGKIITTLNVENADTIYKVKASIFYETGYLPERHHLFFAREHLKESRTLADYHIQNDSTLVLGGLLYEGPGPNDRTLFSVVTPTGRIVMERHGMHSDTVGDIKERIYIELGIPTDQQIIISGRKRLENDCTLREARDCCSCTFVLRLRDPGGQ